MAKTMGLSGRLGVGDDHRHPRLVGGGEQQVGPECPDARRARGRGGIRLPTGAQAGDFRHQLTLALAQPLDLPPKILDAHGLVSNRRPWGANAFGDAGAKIGCVVWSGLGVAPPGSRGIRLHHRPAVIAATALSTASRKRFSENGRLTKGTWSGRSPG